MIAEQTSYEYLFSELKKRIDKNLADYHGSLMGFGKRELIDMAGKIQAMSDAHSFMSSFDGFGESDLRFYLKFRNPLEVVADAWNEYDYDIDGLTFTVDSISGRRELLLAEYPHISDTDAPNDGGLRRFMGVDLISFLGKIAEKAILRYHGDFKINIDTLYRAAGSDNQEDRRLMWHVCSDGTHMNTERDTFIYDTGAYNAWVNYRANAPDMFGYVIEVTGRDGNIVTGNVFEVGDYASHAEYVRETSLPIDSVTLTYEKSWGVNSGKSVTVPRHEYDNERNLLMCESGNVVTIRYHPSESVRQMSDLLRQERSRRMSLPIGSMGAHLDKLAKVLSAVRSGQGQEITEKPNPGVKISISARIKSGNDKVQAYKDKEPKNPSTNSKTNRMEEIS